VPFNKKEKFLVELHKNNYSLENASEILEKIKPTDCSDWTWEEKEKFHLEIFRQRKDLKALCVVMNKDMGDILSYYLGKYKKSDHYRLLKTVLIEERIEKANSSLHQMDQCAICEDGGNLLICDGCESEWHMTCTRPALQSIPEGHWECDICTDRKFLEARQHLLRNMWIPCINDRKRKMDDNFKTDVAPVKPSKLQVLEAVRTFSRNVDSIFTPTKKSGPTEQKVNN